MHQGRIDQEGFEGSRRVESSLEIAERFLKSAKKNLEIEEHEMAEIAAYNSSFHAARSLLFAKGYVERSHYCLGIALKVLYGGDVVEMLKTLDKIRLSRHNVQYSGVLVSEEEAQFVINFATEFLEAARMEIYP